MKLHILSCLLVLCGGLHCAAAQTNEPVNLTPAPRSLQMSPQGGSLRLPQAWTISCPRNMPDSLRAEARRLAESLSQSTGMRVSLTRRRRGALLSMQQPADGRATWGPEAYRLSITPQGITAQATTSAGFFYAFQTLKKLLPQGVALGLKVPSPAAGFTLPCLTIDDEPRFAWRGFMLDVARHFFSVAEIKRLIDVMAVYKLNRFHWHLSDDQGWRADIKRWPRLTAVGSVAPNSWQWSWQRREHYYTGRPYGPYFYTQEQMRQVVAYARERHIEVVPEIDMPGHFVAALAAYPEFSCQPDADKRKNWIPWGVSTDVLNVADTAAVGFAQDILSEIITIFPYTHLHIGGDECPTTAWESNALCQQKMQREGLTSARQLQSHFIKTMADYAAARGRRLLLWNESISQPGADTALIRSTDATVMCWTGAEAAALKAARMGMPYIITPITHYYINRRQRQDNDWMPVAGNGQDDLRRTYLYRPIPAGMPATGEQLCRGVQATFWTEHVADSTLLEYLALPRLMAIAETAWSPEERKDFADFCRRMAQDTVMLRMGGYRYSPHYLDGKEQP